MDAPLPKGTIVKQVVPAIEGVISDVAFDANRLGFNYLVSYKDALGTEHARWFANTEVAPKQNDTEEDPQ